MQVLVLLLLLGEVLTSKLGCSEYRASRVYNRHVYDFSMEILHRVSMSERGTFVFSPISTWLQLLHLYEGSVGSTGEQLQKVIGKGNDCLKNIIERVATKSFKNAGDVLRSYVVLDEFLDVKPEYKAKVQSQGLTELVTVKFNDPSAAKYTVNRMLEEKSRGAITGLFDENDFEKTVLLLFDIIQLKTPFATPFDPSGTTIAPFYTNYGSRQVEMMSQVGIFNLTTLPTLGVTVLEMPCDRNDRIKMLLIQSEDIPDVFTILGKTRLKGIFNSFKRNGEQAVRVSMPKLDISSYVDNIPELLFDMGLKDVFDPDLANLKGISDYKLFASSVKQIASLEAKEGSRAVVEAPRFTDHEEDVKVFKLDQPFAFLVVDKVTEVILLGGVFLEPDDG